MADAGLDSRRPGNPQRSTLGQGPSGRPAEDLAQFAVWLGVTSAVMFAECLLACIVPARRALSINPSDALKET